LADLDRPGVRIAVAGVGQFLVDMALDDTGQDSAAVAPPA
jgi:hypothetical protein